MNLFDIGWNHYSPHRPPPDFCGRIAACSRDRFTVWTDLGEIDATLSGRIRHSEAGWPVTGDWVLLRDKQVIQELLPRRTKLFRKKPGSDAQTQLLATNIDVLFIVTALDRDYNERRLERYLVLAHQSGARPVVILNKFDLCPDLNAFINRTKQIAPGIAFVALSAQQGIGLAELVEHIAAGQTVALIGSSGAGKSTIINRILDQTVQQTREVRSIDGKGRHTTVRRELFCAPQGWLMMDLPGLREVGLYANPESVEAMDEAFADITALASMCRFSDCAHAGEPGCAVRKTGISDDRLQSYRKLARELERGETDAGRSRKSEDKRLTKAMNKFLRSHPKR